MADKKTDQAVEIDEQLHAAMNRMKKADTDIDAFPAWDFDTTPVLQGTVVKVKSTTQIRRGEEVEVRLAVIDAEQGHYMLWESANLGEFFDNIGAGTEIIVVYKGMEELKGNKRMRIYDAYYS